MNHMEHLAPNRHALLSLPDEARIHEVQKDNIYIESPAPMSVIGILRNMLKTSDRVQAPCLIVTGEGGSGKTSIIRQIKADRLMSEQLVFVALNVNPYNLKFGELLADALGVPPGNSVFGKPRKDLLPRELGEVIKLRGIKGLVIDELHDAMLVPRGEQQRNLSILKGLSNSPYCLTVVGFGTSAAKNALTYDYQLSRRFYKVELGDWYESEDFRSFLAGIEFNLPLRLPSGLDGPEIVSLLIEITNGRMDDVIKLIKSAACYAICSGDERITPEGLRQAAASPWGYEQ
ncbi:TniB family NTP-binding protein [Pseudomonas aeruginosa]|uniref:TniB family NTP-binding protein n=1 Tax=Pseudomonas aeruginosa TaxID=287 RepID=UPI000F549D54|nr:TniB family NTP-binding protein [Pseudomonas aeruginosa]RPM29678.1 transposase [Pseudomonas aeruginosa]